MKKSQEEFSVSCRSPKTALLRAASIVLAIVIVLSTMGVFTLCASANVQKKYEIAVAFDNSGSMYTDNRTRWCQAKYAMEIFASMLDYDNGDRLNIYTMWNVTVDKSSPTTHLEIASKTDIDKIGKMYTVYGKDGNGKYILKTPYAPVAEAHAALKKSNADEKWLVVLTDGDFNMETRDERSKLPEDFNLNKRLLDITKDDIKVQFLGLELESGAQEVKASGNLFSDEASEDNNSDDNLKNKLIEVCNKIFQRNELEDSLDGHELTLDMSMSKLIVFVQGDSAKVPVLKDSNGNVINAKMDSGLRQFSRIKANNYENAKVDESLFGQVVTYENCGKGEYTLEYSGPEDNVQIFYEPNVAIKVIVRNSDGQEVDPEKEVLYPGKYSFEYFLVDHATKKDVTDSELLGDEVTFECEAEITNGSSMRSQFLENGGYLELTAGDEVFLNIKGTYLEDFTITTQDDIEGFTFIIKDFPEVTDFKVKTDVLQEENWYTLKDREKWKPIKVSFTVGGQPLTDEQVARVAPKITFEPEIPFMYEIMQGESAIAVYIAKDENGNDSQTEPETGDYKINIEAVYTDENGKVSNSDKDKASFKISFLDTLIIKILGLALLLLLAILIYILTHRPAFPENIVIYRRLSNNKYIPEGGESIFAEESFVAELDGTLVFEGEAKKVSPWCDRKKESARLKVKVTNHRADVARLNIGGDIIKLSESPEIEITDGTRIILDTRKGVREEYEIRINSDNETIEEE